MEPVVESVIMLGKSELGKLRRKKKREEGIGRRRTGDVKFGNAEKNDLLLPDNIKGFNI